MSTIPDRRLRLGPVGLFLPLLLLACSDGGSVTDHLILQDSFDRLRADFDAEAGKVRAIFLASPT